MNSMTAESTTGRSSRNGHLIELRDIVKYYGSTCALDHVDFCIGNGITGLLGPNGAGKSTLIKVILGLLKVTSGGGTVMGLRLGPDGKKIRAVTGFMPEDDCYIPGLSGVQVVQFSAALAGLPSVEGMRRAHEILDFCGVQQERYREIETYSAGMRQKIKFASAIVHDPQLLILDEPTSFLDPEEREDLLNRIRILADEFQKPVILCTHILRDVQMICDEVVILLKGKIRLQQSMAELSRPSAPVTELQVDGNEEKLKAALEKRRISVERTEVGFLRVGTVNPEVLSQIWQASRELGITILSMSPAKNSLEQIFMTAVRGEANANQ